MSRTTTKPNKVPKIKPVKAENQQSNGAHSLIVTQSQELTRWHEVKTQERESSRRGYCVPWVKRRINEVHTRKYGEKKVSIALPPA